jgi:hypothetical protein
VNNKYSYTPFKVDPVFKTPEWVDPTAIAMEYLNFGLGKIF